MTALTSSTVECVLPPPPHPQIPHSYSNPYLAGLPPVTNLPAMVNQIYSNRIVDNSPPLLLSQPSQPAFVNVLEFQLLSPHLKTMVQQYIDQQLCKLRLETQIQKRTIEDLLSSVANFKHLLFRKKRELQDAHDEVLFAMQVAASREPTPFGLDFPQQPGTLSDSAIRAERKFQRLMAVQPQYNNADLESDSMSTYAESETRLGYDDKANINSIQIDISSSQRCTPSVSQRNPINRTVDPNSPSFSHSNHYSFNRDTQYDADTCDTPPPAFAPHHSLPRMGIRMSSSASATSPEPDNFTQTRLSEGRSDIYQMGDFNLDDDDDSSPLGPGGHDIKYCLNVNVMNGRRRSSLSSQPNIRPSIQKRISCVNDEIVQVPPLTYAGRFNNE